MFAGFIQDRELRKTRAKGSFSKIPHQSVKTEQGAAAVTLTPSGEGHHQQAFSTHRGKELFVVVVFGCLVTGLFEQRVEQYLEELPDTEQSGVNKFLKGLGEFCSQARKGEGGAQKGDQNI